MGADFLNTVSLQCSGFPHANTKRAGLRRPQQNSIFTQLIPPVIFFGFCVKSFEFSEKCSINKCIVRVTLRSGYSNNSLYFQKKGNCSRPHYWWAFNSFCTLGLFSFRHSSDFFFTSAHKGRPEVYPVRTVWPSSLSSVQCKYSWSERRWQIWAIW